ncbi:hypothetical protein GOL30_20825 [Sinorhizobium medicae]|uniref:hypothetical protein n=1 Tax=Sinorhizobium medicae TaxID=110321 RepID=UPI0004627194|nr:hypothetical protein [Sinorhizobium medicae]MDX0428005.1 hypothetical protein [Sinorhizobium medicae]MDX0987673.1 hypothetical protein [Sinorhizobium medicae]MDX1077169.1 hypothetical protein [Sinorhizobium medicae]MQW01351.1 hypothetical protein [Sinorhizobium medicae]
MNDEHRNQIIDIWKAVVEVQRHFNEISMRIRGMFVTILLAFFAAMGFMIDRKLTLDVLGLHVQYAIIVAGFGLFATWLFYFIDRYWYHRLLSGSVKHAIIIETKYKADIPELSLSAAIGDVSAYEPRGPVSWLAWLLVGHEKYKQDKKLHSDGKIELFYKSVMLVLVVAMIMISFAGGIARGNTLDAKRAEWRCAACSVDTSTRGCPAGIERRSHFGSSQSEICRQPSPEWLQSAWRLA